MTELAEFHLESYFSHWEFSVRHNLAASDAQTVTLAELLAMATPAQREQYDSQPLGYTATFGAEDLRQAIAATYTTRTAADILCFAGAGEGIYVCMRVLLGSNDHAIIVTPNYQSAESVPADICAITGIPLDPADEWSLDIDAVAAAIRPTTRLISINFPHNPTGKILEPDRLEALVALCRRHGLWLFSDEAYRPLGPTATVHLPQVADLYERGISLGVLSKAFGLAGLRLGWIAVQDRALLQKLERYKHYLSICNAGPSERLAVIALGASNRLLGRNRAIIDRNLVLLDRFFASHEDRFEWRAGDGGCIAFPRYRPAAHDPGVTDRFANALVQHSGVLLLPGSVFRSTLAPVFTDRFRIGYGRTDLPAGLAAFEQFLQAS